MRPRSLLLVPLLAFCAVFGAESGPAVPAPEIKRDPAGTVTLQATAPDATILYTLDGADPTEKSNPYLAPIALANGGTLKARAFSANRKTKSDLREAAFEPLPGRSPLPSTVVPVTQDRSWPKYDWKKRHALTSAAVKRAQPRLLLIGDSITHFFGGEQFDDYALRGPKTWDEFFAPYGAGNLGFGWDKTENVLWRLQHGAVDGIAPKLIVMMIGTNNTATCAATDIAAGITAIVDELNRRLPQSKILLLAIFPRGEKPGPPRDKIAEVNRNIAALGGTRRVTFLDIGQTFLTSDGLITKDIMPDFLHPNEKGYRLWAEAIAPTVKQLMGD